jgi:O-acetyl-ADP-ribose deacetylase (regulator of RNase III)
MNQLSYKKGNLFTSSAQTIVNTVNCVGIMGAGIALEFKYRYPEMYKKYVELCKNNQIQTGRLWLYNKDINRKWVLNFPTKKDWKHPSKLEYLESGLEKFLKFYKERNITSIAFPLLGAQNGGIDPEQSLTTMKNYLSKCDIFKTDPGVGKETIEKCFSLHYLRQ